jgi:hypothetical protein
MNLIFVPVITITFNLGIFEECITLLSLHVVKLTTNSSAPEAPEASRIDSEIMVVADRVFGLVGFDFLASVLQEDFAAPLRCVVLV